MREPPVKNRKKFIYLKVRGRWELSEPEVKGDDDAPLGKGSCHASTPHGNTFMLEQVSLWKQVSPFRSNFVDTLLVFYLSNKIENVLSKKFLLCTSAESKICFVLFSGTADRKATCPN